MVISYVTHYPGLVKHKHGKCNTIVSSLLWKAFSHVADNRRRLLVNEHPPLSLDMHLIYWSNIKVIMKEHAYGSK